MPDPKDPRRSRVPVLDTLGKLCTEGKQTAEYLWQVPKDEAARGKITDLLQQITTEAGKQGRKEMARIVSPLDRITA